jgi:hypothetical protein
MAEEWKPVEEAPGYQVSIHGEVMGRRGKLLTLVLNQFGYKTVTPYVGGKTIYRQVHRLVAQAFIPNPDKLPIVNHIDGDRQNNCVANLEWVTAKQNAERIVKSTEVNTRRSRKVVQTFPDGHTETWASLTEAATEANIKPDSMARWCEQGATDLAGSIWHFLEDVEPVSEDEQWAWVSPLEGKPPVEVSTHGRIRLKTGQIIMGTTKGNYNRYQRYGVHRLVAMAFRDKRPGSDVVNHLDGNPANNRATNLEWTTQQGNCVHAHDTGLCRRRPVRRTAPSGQITDYVSIKEASRLTKISAGDIVHVCKGQKKRAGGSTWEYISNEQDTPPTHGPPVTVADVPQLISARSHPVLSDDDIDALLAAWQ